MRAPTASRIRLFRADGAELIGIAERSGRKSEFFAVLATRPSAAYLPVAPSSRDEGLQLAIRRAQQGGSDYHGRRQQVCRRRAETEAPANEDDVAGRKTHKPRIRVIRRVLDCLPQGLAIAMLGRRLQEPTVNRRVLDEHVRFVAQP